MRLLLQALAIVLAAGCPSSPDRDPGGPRPTGDSGGQMDALADSGEDAGFEDTGPEDTGVAMIPDPGVGTGLEWTDVEPNNDPSTAVPQGILVNPVWMGFTMPFTTIDNDTDVDFFVFKTGDTASLANVFIGTCWSIGRDLLNLYLYRVDAGVQGPLIDSAESTDATCENMIAFGEGSTVLTADTIYLLEVRAAPGLVLGADTGLYMA